MKGRQGGQGKEKQNIPYDMMRLTLNAWVPQLCGTQYLFPSFPCCYVLIKGCIYGSSILCLVSCGTDEGRGMGWYQMQNIDSF